VQWWLAIHIFVVGTGSMYWLWQNCVGCVVSANIVPDSILLCVRIQFLSRDESSQWCWVCLLRFAHSLIAVNVECLGTVNALFWLFCVLMALNMFDLDL